MVAKDVLTTVVNNKGELDVKSARVILKELKVATAALRRINFLSRTFSHNNPHLDEIEKISSEVLTKKENSV